MRRVHLLWALWGPACAAPSPIHLELPPEAIAADVHTLVVALEDAGSTQAQLIDLDTRRTELPRLIPGLPAWDDTPAAYTVLAYAATAAELDVQAGPIDAPAAGASVVTLPPADRAFRAVISADPPTAWETNPALPPALTGLTLARARQPIDCKTQFVRSLAVGSRTTDVLEVLATGPESALLLIREEPGRDPVLAELFESGDTATRPLPPEVQRLAHLATNGADVWATDVFGRLLLLDLHGELRALSPAGAMTGVIAGPEGRSVYGWRQDRIFTLVAGSTRAEAWPVLAGAPPFIEALGVAPSGDAAVLASPSVWVLQGRAWRNELTPAPEFGDVAAVAADELGFYAVTGASLFRRAIDERAWSPLPDVGTFERTGIAAFGHGRLAVVGVGGFIEVAGNLPPYTGWCQITAGTLREIERVSVDPTRQTLFAIDSLDRDGSEDRALVLRVTLPR